METPYDIMPLATVDPGAAMASTRPFAATAARLKAALASYERSSYLQPELQDEALSGRGVTRLEAFVNHVAERYPSAFQPPSDKKMIDVQSMAFAPDGMIQYSTYWVQALAAQAEYMALWDVYRKVRNTVTMTQWILEKLNQANRGILGPASREGTLK